MGVGGTDIFHFLGRATLSIASSRASASHSAAQLGLLWLDRDFDLLGCARGVPAFGLSAVSSGPSTRRAR